MATVRAIGNYHGSDGYKFAGQQWDVSQEEADGLVQQGTVEIVEATPAQEPQQEEGQPNTDAANQSNTQTDPVIPETPTEESAPQEKEEKRTVKTKASNQPE